MVNMIIGAINNYKWDQIKYWCNSIEMSGFEGRKVIIAFNIDRETYETLVTRGFEVVTPGLPMTDGSYFYKFTQTVHLERFNQIWRFLCRQKDVKYVVTTDVRDVVFQLNPFNFFNHIGKTFVCGSECLKYKDEPWGRDNFRSTFGDVLYEKYKDREIYNVGAFGGSFEFVRDMCLSIYQMGINRPIPICDQAVFNFILYQSIIDDCSISLASMCDGWTIHCGTVLDPSKLESFRPNLLEGSISKDFEWVLPDGTLEYDAAPAMILHQYDRVPELKVKVEAKYG